MRHVQMPTWCVFWRNQELGKRVECPHVTVFELFKDIARVNLLRFLEKSVDTKSVQPTIVRKMLEYLFEFSPSL